MKKKKNGELDIKRKVEKGPTVCLFFKRCTVIIVIRRNKCFSLEVPVAPQGILFCMQAALLVGKNIVYSSTNGFSLSLSFTVKHHFNLESLFHLKNI